MKRDKKRKTIQETLSSVDGVLAAINAYPSLEDALLEKAQDEINKRLGKWFPTQLDFSNWLLEHLVGTDVMIEIISKFLTVALPGVEVSLKAALLANMQNLGTNCTIDPIIYEKAIKEGVIFDLKQIDLIDKLSISPLDEKLGQYYYFGIEGCESAYDVLMSAIDPNNQTDKQKLAYARKNFKLGIKQEKDENMPLGIRLTAYNAGPTQKEGTSYMNRAMTDSVGHYFGGRKRDFDCLLWYMKNKAAYREVWGKRTSQSEDIFNGSSDIDGWINKKGDKDTKYYLIKDKDVTFKGKVSGGSTNGKIELMNTSQKYIFKDGNSTYVYEYKNASIKKLSRKKKYYSNAHGVFYFDNGEKEWKTTDLTYKNNYRVMEELPTTIQKGNYVMVDRSVFQITDNPKVKNRVKDDETTKYVSYVKSEECIDITNDLVNNTCVFVDYDLDGNADKIKNGVEVVSSLTSKNKGQQKWIKRKVKKDETPNVTIQNCYYEKRTEKKVTNFDANVDKILIPPYYENKSGKLVPCVNLNDAMEKKNKYTKDFGVLTLEFSPRTGNVLQSDGDPMQQQTPYDNVLHVFFGNVKELHTSERDALQDTWKESADVNQTAKQAYKAVERLIRKNLELKKELEIEKKKKKCDTYYYGDTHKDVSVLFEYANYQYTALLKGSKEYKERLDVTSGLYENPKKLSDKINEIVGTINTYVDKIYVKGGFNYEQYKPFIDKLEKNLDGYSFKAYVDRASQMMEANENLVYLSAKNLKYPEAKKNYYYHRTLFEFNADYVNSLQLFDPKVLAAQLITSLFGGATISAMVGATAQWKSELIHDVVKDMVEKVIAAEDVAVSDCFFTFTNDAYNGMLRASELRQAGLYSKHGEQNGNSKIDPVKILEGLNGIDDAADQAGQTTVIKGAIENAAVEVSKDVYKEDNHLAVNTNFGIKMSFVETLMINLCTQCVMAMLSPKVYLLILINLQMFGLSTNFDLKAFLERFANLIRSLVKSVVDQFMQYIIQEIMKLIEELLQKLIVKISFEQVEMYARLLKQILMHLRMLLGRFRGKTYGWTQDYVSYADITTVDTQEPINEC